LQTIQSTDQLLEILQHPPPASEAETIHLLDALMARLRGLERTWTSAAPLSAGATANGVSSAAEQTQEVYDFLAPAQEADEIGRLGDYRILKVLGAGGMGVVFEAHDPQLQRRVALKVLRPGLALSPAARRRFLREAQSPAGLVHDHIVSILHVGADRDLPFLVMPLLEGETLEQRLKREGKLAVAEVLRLGGEIAAGLAAAHDHGLIHRDVKPSNVWLEDLRKDDVRRIKDESEEVSLHPSSFILHPTSDRVKLLDFGLARLVADDEQLTHSGMILGTPAYMAPEQGRGQPLDARCDLFSLGCILYRMCTGQVPFPGTTTMAILRALELEQPRPPQAMNPEVPRPLSDLVLWLLAKRPEDRPPSAREVGKALAAIRDGRSEHIPRYRSRRRWVPLAAAMVMLAGLAMVAYFLAPTLFSPEMPAADLPAKRSHLAQPCHFHLQVTYPVGKRPYAVAVGDFNKDGKLDLAVSNINNHTVSVLLGKGDGSFHPAVEYAAGREPHGLAVADFNGDGRPDLVVANLGSDAVTVLLGKGDGAFEAPRKFAVGTHPRGVAVGDFNGDGKLDIAVANIKGSTVSVLLGKGDGSFHPAVQYQCPGGPLSVAVADLDGDGRLDLVASSGGGNLVSVLRGKGNGTFQTARTYGVGSGPGAVVVADFDGDGWPDVAVENFGSNDVSVLLNKGDGTLRAAASYPAGSGPGGLAVGDFNGDGVPDLVVANHHSMDIGVLLGNADGTFRTALPFAAGWTPAGVAVADLNGDGRTDIIVVNHHAGTVSVFLNRPPAPHFQLTANQRVVAGVSHAVSLHILDAWNNTDTSYRGRLCFRSTDPRANLPKRDAPLSPGEAWTPTAAFMTAGAQTLIVYDEANPERVGSVTTLVIPGRPVHFRLKAPARVTSGKPFLLEVIPLDAFDNEGAGFAGTVRFTSSDPRAVFSGDPLLAAPNGTARTFRVTLMNPGRQQVTVATTVNPSLNGSTTVTVEPGHTGP
jgi:serine/threonine protein kinase